MTAGRQIEKKRVPVAVFAYGCLVVYWFCSTIYSLIAEPVHHLAFVSAGSFHMADFVQMYEGGKMAFSPQRHLLYDVDYQLRLLNQIIAPLHADRMLPLTYLPVFYACLAPLSWLPLLPAYQVWRIGTLVLGVLALMLFASQQRRLQRLEILLLCAGAVVSLPSQISLQLGQTSWALLGMACLFFWALKRGNDTVAGVCLALSLVKPQYTLFLLIPPLVLGRWRLLLVAAIAGSIGCAITAAAFGWASFLDYPRYLLQTAYSPRCFGMDATSHSNLRALLALLMPDSIALKVSPLILVLALAATALLWRRYSKAGGSGFDWAIAYTCVLSLIGAPHSNFHDSLLLAAAAAAILPSISLAALRPTQPSGYRLFLMTLVMVPLISFLTMLAASFNPILKGYAMLAVNLLLLSAGGIYFYQSSLDRQAIAAEPIAVDKA